MLLSAYESRVYLCFREAQSPEGAWVLTWVTAGEMQQKMRDTALPEQQQKKPWPGDGQIFGLE